MIKKSQKFLRSEESQQLRWSEQSQKLAIISLAKFTFLLLKNPMIQNLTWYFLKYFSRGFMS